MVYDNLFTNVYGTVLFSKSVIIECLIDFTFIKIKKFLQS